jgi:hypothetical protein
LNDIVIGSSSGCGTTGFAAAKGWDPWVTLKAT